MICSTKTLLVRSVITVLILLMVLWVRTGWLAYAAGDLVVSFDGASGKPMFDVRNMVPGEYVEKNVTVYNGSSREKAVSVRGIATSVKGSVDKALAITVREGNDVLYAEQSLNRFLSDSASTNGVVLSSVFPGKTVVYTITIRMVEYAGNQFQSKRLTMDIFVGSGQDIPPQCARIHLDGQFIYGTDRSERLQGTNNNDLIMTGEGNDIIDGRNGSDCIVATSGNKIIIGGKGNDIVVMGSSRGIVFGEEGDDVLLGTRQSVLHGGSGTDVCIGGLRIGCERDTL